MVSEHALGASPRPKRSIYENSTQHRNWRFSLSTLTNLRSTINNTAVDAIRSTIEADTLGSSSIVEFLTWQDELALVKFYLGKVGPLCRRFRFPEEVEATTISYMKRFYLKNTVMDWHPKNVMLTTLFLATKTTNNPITLDSYASNVPNTTPAAVLELEFLVAQSLSFEFAVWHVHRALWGIYLDLQTLPDCDMEAISSAYTAALQHVQASRLTDAELVHPPSQIALACLYLSSQDLAEQWAQEKCGDAESSNIMASLRQIVTMIEQEGAMPDVEIVRGIDRRLKVCKNPEKVVGSRAFIQKQAETEAKAAAKRNKKVEESRLRASQEDPFGGGLIDSTVSMTINGNAEDDDD